MLAAEGKITELAALGPAAVPALRRFLIRGTIKEQRTAIKGLLMVGVVGWRVLQEVLMQEKAPVRKMVAMEVVRNMLLQYGDYETEKAAVNAMGEIGDPTTIPELRHALYYGRVKGVQEAAARALWLMGPVGLQTLNDALTHWDPSVKKIVSNVVVEMGKAQKSN